MVAALAAARRSDRWRAEAEATRHRRRGRRRQLRRFGPPVRWSRAQGLTARSTRMERTSGGTPAPSRASASSATWARSAGGSAAMNGA